MRGDVPQQRRYVDAATASARGRPGVEARQHFHRVVECVEFGLDAGTRRIREAANLGWGEHRYALPELVRGAARLLGKKPGQLLPGQPVAVQGVIAFLTAWCILPDYAFFCYGRVRLAPRESWLGADVTASA